MSEVESKPVVEGEEARVEASVEATASEETESVEFHCRTKVYRFDRAANEWKERGVGTMKMLLKKDGLPFSRVVVRRDQTFKVCVNFIVHPLQVLEASPGSDSAWSLTCQDFSDGEVQNTIFAIRFKSVEDATAFKTNFERLQGLIAPHFEEAEESGPSQTLALSMGVFVYILMQSRDVSQALCMCFLSLTRVYPLWASVREAGRQSSRPSLLLVLSGLSFCLALVGACLYLSTLPLMRTLLYAVHVLFISLFALCVPCLYGTKGLGQSAPSRPVVDTLSIGRDALGVMVLVAPALGLAYLDIYFHDPCSIETLLDTVLDRGVEGERETCTFIPLTGTAQFFWSHFMRHYVCLLFMRTVYILFGEERERDMWMERENTRLSGIPASSIAGRRQRKKRERKPSATPKPQVMAYACTYAPGEVSGTPDYPGQDPLFTTLHALLYSLVGIGCGCLSMLTRERGFPLPMYVYVLIMGILALESPFAVTAYGLSLWLEGLEPLDGVEDGWYGAVGAYPEMGASADTDTPTWCLLLFSVMVYASRHATKLLIDSNQRLIEVSCQLHPIQCECDTGARVSQSITARKAAEAVSLLQAPAGARSSVASASVCNDTEHDLCALCGDEGRDAYEAVASSFILGSTVDRLRLTTEYHATTRMTAAVEAKQMASDVFQQFCFACFTTQTVDNAFVVQKLFSLLGALLHPSAERAVYAICPTQQGEQPPPGVQPRPDGKAGRGREGERWDKGMDAIRTTDAHRVAPEEGVAETPAQCGITRLMSVGSVLAGMPDSDLLSCLPAIDMSGGFVVIFSPTFPHYRACQPVGVVNSKWPLFYGPHMSAMVPESANRDLPLFVCATQSLVSDAIGLFFGRIGLIGTKGGTNTESLEPESHLIDVVFSGLRIADGLMANHRSFVGRYRQLSKRKQQSLFLSRFLTIASMDSRFTVNTSLDMCAMFGDTVGQTEEQQALINGVAGGLHSMFLAFYAVFLFSMLPALTQSLKPKRRKGPVLCVVGDHLVKVDSGQVRVFGDPSHNNSTSMPINLCTVLEDLVTNLEPLARKQNTRLTLYCDANVPETTLLKHYMVVLKALTGVITNSLLACDPEREGGGEVAVHVTLAPIEDVPRVDSRAFLRNTISEKEPHEMQFWSRSTVMFTAVPTSAPKDSLFINMVVADTGRGMTTQKLHSCFVVFNKFIPPTKPRPVTDESMGSVTDGRAAVEGSQLNFNMLPTQSSGSSLPAIGARGDTMSWTDVSLEASVLQTDDRSVHSFVGSSGGDAFSSGPSQGATRGQVGPELALKLRRHRQQMRGPGRYQIESSSSRSKSSTLSGDTDKSKETDSSWRDETDMEGERERERVHRKGSSSGVDVAVGEGVSMYNYESASSQVDGEGDREGSDYSDAESDRSYVHCLPTETEQGGMYADSEGEVSDDQRFTDAAHDEQKETEGTGVSIGVHGTESIGMGYSFLFETMRMTNGSFRVASDPGNGTVVCMTLPLTGNQSHSPCDYIRTEVPGTMAVVFCDEYEEECLSSALSDCGCFTVSGTSFPDIEYAFQTGGALCVYVIAETILDAVFARVPIAVLRPHFDRIIVIASGTGSEEEPVSDNPDVASFMQYCFRRQAWVFRPVRRFVFVRAISLVLGIKGPVCKPCWRQAVHGATQVRTLLTCLDLGTVDDRVM
ncbi:hypothetical protein KIPB_002317 [Kipferlia bialata]|uniref:RanBD1 domain-containing protein n=1 Tax=Kipferlia bialata TaxID=797122 RepID=A0A9K3CQE7_9EUKA|nr:hypothetical protein KIPB_002317 [Kipferlia bialata]|eukprot:g2317.t1